MKTDILVLTEKKKKRHETENFGECIFSGVNKDEHAKRRGDSWQAISDRIITANRNVKDLQK